MRLSGPGVRVGGLAGVSVGVSVDVCLGTIFLRESFKPQKLVPTARSRLPSAVPGKGTGIPVWDFILTR